MTNPKPSNQVLDAGFIADACLTAPLPEQWSTLPAAAIPKRRCVLGLQASIGLISFLMLYFVLGLSWAPWLVLGLLLWLIGHWCYLPKQWRHCRFLLRRQDFILQSGVWWHRAVLIPLTKVQHVSVSQGPLQKRFGLATLKVFSAGGFEAEAALPDIDEHLAYALSEQLSRLIPAEVNDAADQ